MKTLFDYDFDFRKMICVAHHKMMWLWLAENPEMIKTDFFNQEAR